MSKHERVEAVNQIIQAIGQRGRWFFTDGQGNYARFVLVGDKRKFLHFLNADGSYVNPYDIRKDRHFMHGGTLWALVQDFKDYILTGSHTNGKHGYGGLFASGWGYSDREMEEIIKLAMEVGFLRQATTV